MDGREGSWCGGGRKDGNGMVDGNLELEEDSAEEGGNEVGGCSLSLHVTHTLLCAVPSGARLPDYLPPPPPALRLQSCYGFYLTLRLITSSCALDAPQRKLQGAQNPRYRNRRDHDVTVAVSTVGKAVRETRCNGSAVVVSCSDLSLSAHH